MNRNEFNRFIAGDALPGPGDLEGLRELTVLFPWFHSAHMLLLRGLKENADIRFDAQLKASALSVSDREVLYHYLFMQPAVETKKEEAVPVAEVKEEIIQEEAAPVTEVQEEIIQELDAPVAEVQEEIAHEETAPVAEVQEEIIQEVDSPVAETQEEIIQEEAAPVAEVQEEIIQEVDSPVAETQEEIIQEEVIHKEAAPTETMQAETLFDEIIPEETAAESVADTEAEPPATEGSTWRTREELMAEIEARLEELSSQHEEVPETETRLEEPSSQHEEVPEIETRVEEFSSQQEEVPETETAVTQDAELPETETQVPQEAEMHVTGVQPEPEPAGEELLELLTDNEPPAPEPAKPLTPRDLIDRFIQNSPNLERIPLAESQPVKDLSEPATEEHGKFITETLAKIYINQGYYTRAINIYEKLSLQFPEKSAYFAGRIEKIKDLIK